MVFCSNLRKRSESTKQENRALLLFHIILYLRFHWKMLQRLWLRHLKFFWYVPFGTPIFLRLAFGFKSIQAWRVYETKRFFDAYNIPSDG